MKDFVTESEAIKRWCPMARAADEDGAAVNRGPVDDPGSHCDCIASGCMAWRWSHQEGGPNDPPTGFCGMAGLPKYI